VKYPAKILLFGEHILMQGAKALAAPLWSYGGSWIFSQQDVSSNQMRLREWVAYLETLEEIVPMDVSAFRRELSDGIYFKSDIPVGYGLGSSGALCAAAYDRYALHKIERRDSRHWPALKKIFAAMEGFFHGASSGIDPLIAFLSRPTLLEPDGIILPAELPKLSLAGIRLFLLDSKISRQTEPLVSYFRNCCANPDFLHQMQAKLLFNSDRAIKAWTEGRMSDFQNAFYEVSCFQLTQLPTMIPAEILAVWRDGLQEESFTLKFCGAGGGGMFLGLAFDWERTRHTLAAWPILELDF
jgi:mevalonate kinase